MQTSNFFESLKPTGKVKTSPVNQGDQWAETPILACGMTEDSEHKSAWPVGATIAGIFRGLREKKNPGPKTCKDYGIFESEKGEKFRVDAPGSLRYQLENSEIGDYLTITYQGKEYAESLKTDVHAFQVESAKAARQN